MWPKAKTIKLGSCDARITDKPCRWTECHKYAYKRQHKRANCKVAGQAAFLHLDYPYLTVVFTAGTTNINRTQILRTYNLFSLTTCNIKQYF
jgi:hypothetical protein